MSEKQKGAGMSEQEREDYVWRRIREHEERGDTSYNVGDFYEEWDTRERYTGGPLAPPHRLDNPLDCPYCGSVNVHYIGDLWQCNGCGEVFPDGDLASPVPPCPRCSSTGGEALTFEYQALLGGRYYCPDCGAAYGERLKDGEA